jgi:preprotein translocase subunit SecD
VAGAALMLRGLAIVTAALLVWVGAGAAEPLAVQITSAAAGFDQRTNEPIVTFRMSEASARPFAELTRNNVGRPMALRVDGRVVSKPVIREPLIGGSVQISGQLTVDDARDLATRMQAGSARVEFEIVD